MKLIINSKILYRAGELAKKVLVSNPVVPILENFLITVRAGVVSVTGSNLQTTFEVIIPTKAYEVKGEGAFAVPAVLWQKHLKDTDEPVTIEPNAATFAVILEDSDGRAKFAGENAEDFPKTPEVPYNGYDLSLPLDQFEDLLKFASRDELRPAMTGVYFKANNGTLNLIATDGHRLRITDTTQTYDGVSFIVPNPVLKAIRNFNHDVTVHTNKTNVLLQLHKDEFRVNVTARIIDELYPDYAAVWPKEKSAKVIATFHREDLVRAIGRALNFANKTTYQVRLVLNGKVAIEVEDLDFSNEYNARLNGEWKAGPATDEQTKEGITIGFNGKFLQEVLNTFAGDSVCLDLTQPNKAGVWSDPNDPNTKALLMPVMLADYK